ncbi:hypothetical protein C8Q70DRAFT_127015 [Cubamyces menziesii]|nr:hypothetical protein C8Q70DRAFT_127015 [Cubamyces menziesii]
MQRRPMIPLEICLDVIDRLSLDCCTLRACALTCSAWLPRARVHLYKSITLHKPETYRLFSQAIAGTPILGALVTNLECCVTTVDDEIWDDAAATEALFPIEAVRTLTRLHYLALMGADCHYAIHPKVLDFVPRFTLATSATSLLVSEFTVTSPKDIIDMLKHFPHIQELSLDHHTSYRDFDAPPIETLPSDFCRDLTDFVFHWSDLYAPFLAVMPTHITVLDIEYLPPTRVRAGPEDSWADIARFKGLETLYLNAHHGEGKEWVAEALQHARCDKLESLGLDYTCECQNGCEMPFTEQHANLAHLASIIFRSSAFRKLKSLHGCKRAFSRA